MDWKREEFVLTDHASRVDLVRTQALLRDTYWGVRRPPDVVARMLEHSLPFVLLHDGAQIGFGRVVTDYTVFSWVADIVIDPPYDPAHADGAPDSRCPCSLRKVRL
jgi:hypothetical protein